VAANDLRAPKPDFSQSAVSVQRTDFIVPSGGGYFFMPSLTALKNHFGE
jgi:hypothetical protein